MTLELPHNPDVEKATIGSMLLDPDSVYLAIPLLKPEYFYESRNRIVFRVIIKLSLEDSPIDIVTVADRLQSEGALVQVGGNAYLTELMESTPSSLHVEYYARTVRDYYKLRSIILTARRVIEQTSGANATNIQDTLDKSSDLLYNSLLEEGCQGAVNSERLMVDFWNYFERRYNNPVVAEVTTGFPELDAVTGGYNPSDLVVVAGRPSWGKTSFVMSSFLRLGEDGIPAVLFPYEMSEIQTSQRFVSMSARVPLTKIRSAVGLNDAELNKVIEATSELSRYPIHVDTSVGDVNYLTSAIRAQVHRNNVRVVAVDYLQIIPTETADLTNEFGRITRTLKSLAVSLGITVILVSQLNRALEARDDRRPRLADLRQSGRIEEDADIVIFVYRELDSDTPEDAELMVSKNRNGPAGGSIGVFFDAEITKFLGRKL